MSLIPPNLLEFGDGGGGSLPDGYSYGKDPVTGALQLFEGPVLIAEQNVDGSWFRTSVSTGVGSLHLGGSHSGGVAHSISSCGQNVGFLNEFATQNHGARNLWFPAWQSITTDGSSFQPLTQIVFDVQSQIILNGPQIPAIADYDIEFVASANFCVTSMVITPKADYSGQDKFTFSITSVTTGVLVYECIITKNMMMSYQNELFLTEPYFINNGDNLRLELKTEAGEYVRVTAGSIVVADPHVALNGRLFERDLISTTSLGDVKFSYASADHGGWVKCDGRAISSLPASQRAACAAIGLSGNLPNNEGRVLMIGGESMQPGDTGGSAKIAVNALPNIQIACRGTTSDNNRSHTHTTAATETGATFNQGKIPQFESDFNWGLYQSTSGGVGFYGAGRATVETLNSVNLQHSHTIPALTTGEESQTHVHPFVGATDSLNGGVDQSDSLPPYVARNEFIFLGQ